MRINELKRIAEENNYIIKSVYKGGCNQIVLYSQHYTLPEEVISILSEVDGMLRISNGSCYEEDLNMIKAAIEFAETPIEDREEEKKFDTDLADFELVEVEE